MSRCQQCYSTARTWAHHRQQRKHWQQLVPASTTHTITRTYIAFKTLLNPPTKDHNNKTWLAVQNIAIRMLGKLVESCRKEVHYMMIEHMYPTQCRPLALKPQWRPVTPMITSIKLRHFHRELEYHGSYLGSQFLSCASFHIQKGANADSSKKSRVVTCTSRLSSKRWLYSSHAGAPAVSARPQSTTDPTRSRIAFHCDSRTDSIFPCKS